MIFQALKYITNTIFLLSIIGNVYITYYAILSTSILFDIYKISYILYICGIILIIFSELIINIILVVLWFIFNVFIDTEKRKKQ